MALTIGSRVDGVIGNKRVVEAVVTFDSSYPTGGEAFTAAELGLGQVDSVVLPSHKLNGKAISDAQAQVGVSIQFDKANSKLKVYTSANTEATNASDQSGVSVVLWFFGA